MSLRIAFNMAALAATLLAGPALAAHEPPKTVQSIMDTVVDPYADSLWESAGTVVTAKGVRPHAPRTSKEWAKARGLALRLVAGAKLLQTRHPVGENGHWVLADGSTPGIRTAAQIDADIGRDPKMFYAAAARLQRTAQDAADALGRKDIDAFLDAGARIDAACEACHAAYWYPRDPPRPLPDPAVFARTAIRP
jgi:hypothetical protein